jgi:predicted  nucleic acid-binding Zn-ribbon protein
MSVRLGGDNMSGNRENHDVIGMLREKSEEADLNEVLKSTFGGYTKKSVQEYINLLRKQQQASRETFSTNLQNLFEEKENIKKNNELLIARYNKLSIEYDNLSEAMKSIKLEESEFSAHDFVAMKTNIISLEEEVKKIQGEKKSLEKEIMQLKLNINDLNTSLNLSNDETQAQKEMLKVERQETKKLRDTIADISRELEEEKSEVKFLKATMTDGKYADLNTKISELHEQLTAQSEVISKLNNESELKDKSNDLLNDEIASLKHRLSSMIQTVQNANIQNDKLLVANDLLKSHLEEEYRKSIELINEKANIAIDKLIAQKKLSNAEAKVTSLELQLEKQNMTKELKNIHTKEVVI